MYSFAKPLSGKSCCFWSQSDIKCCSVWKNNSLLLWTCRAPEPVPRPGSVSAPGGWGEPGHSAGMDTGGALEGPEGGWSFRDSAGVCGGLMEEQIIRTILCPQRNWMHLEGSKIEEARDSRGSASWDHFFLKTVSIHISLTGERQQCCWRDLNSQTFSLYKWFQFYQ